MGNRFPYFFSRVTTLVLVLAASAAAFPQEKERPKLKDFGSSLKKTKPDQKKKDTVEKKPKPNAKSEAEDIEVVKVETSLVSSDVSCLDPKGKSRGWV
jgi:hypothetical protein